MADMVRLTSFVLILIAVVVAAVLQQPDGTEYLDLNVRIVRVWLCPEQKRLDELTKAFQMKERQMEEKKCAVEKLRDGQATLFGTAAIFHRHNLQSGQQPFFPEFPERSSEEIACLQVIRWLAATPGGTNSLVSRLEEELRQYKEHYGAVILPDVEPGS